LSGLFKGRGNDAVGFRDVDALEGKKGGLNTLQLAAGGFIL